MSGDTLGCPQPSRLAYGPAKAFKQHFAKWLNGGLYVIT
jgi:hypothetical protein